MKSAKTALAALALIAGAAVADAAGTGSATIKASSQSLADAWNNLSESEQSALESNMRSNLNTLFSAGTITGTSLKTDGDSLQWDLTIQIDSAKDDKEAQKMINEYIENNKDAIANVLSSAAGSSVSADNISVSGATAARASLATAVGVLLSVLMVA